MKVSHEEELLSLRSELESKHEKELNDVKELFAENVEALKEELLVASDEAKMQLFTEGRAIRLRRICSTDEFFNTHSDALLTHLIERIYTPYKLPAAKPSKHL